MATFIKLWKMNKKHRKNLIQALMFTLLRSALGITQILAIITAMQVVLHLKDVRSGVIQVSIYMVICILGNFVISYFEQINALISGMFMTADLRQDVALLLKKVPLGFFQKSKIESIIATLTTTLQGVEMASSMSIILTISGFFNSIVLFLFMMYYEFHLGIVMLVGILVYVWIIDWQMNVSYKNAPIRQKAQSELSKEALIFSKGIRVIKSYCYPKGNQEFHDAIQESCRANLLLTNKSMPSQFAAGISIAIFESILLALTMYLSLPLEKTIVLLIISYVAFASLNQAGSILSMIGMIESGLDEVIEIKKANLLPVQQPVQIPKEDRVEYRNVHFSYGEREILHGINFCFEKNTLTALIGPSGSGKTTICRLLARFYDVNQGGIFIGGVNIKNIDPDVLMNKISIVFQDVYLFEDTILNNIRFGKPDATLEEVRKAAQAARCDEFIMNLKDGYDTVLQEGGKSLSGGEKQRISIARAILKDSDIIILDEATSALDAENESAFFEAIDALIQNKTVIMIAHRISTIQKADQIIALQDGKIVQMGSPEELSQIPGLYADFIQSRNQAKGWSI